MSLSAAQLREKLRARGVFDLSGNKSELTSKLQKILCGTQKVPSLLVTKPEQPLTELNLESYTILDCEPLHDLKGHVTNLLEETNKTNAQKYIATVQLHMAAS